jgi:hypothetical protein
MLKSGGTIGAAQRGDDTAAGHRQTGIAREHASAERGGAAGLEDHLT